MLDWLKTHKAVIGGIVAFVAGGLAAIGQQEAAAVVGLIASFLVGGGALRADRDH